MKAKKTLIALICIIILFIPTYIAIANYKQAQKSPITDTSVTSVKIIDPNGAVYELSDSKEIKYFTDMSEKGKLMTEMPDEMKNVLPCTVEYNCTNGNAYEFKYYFTEESEDCFYTDYKYKVYRIPSDVSVNFLQSDYSSYLYKGSKQPSLAVNGTEVLPKAMNWSYLTYGDVSKNINCITADDGYKFTVTKGFELAFNTEPDVVTVQITDSGEVVYDGIYENMSSSFAFTEGHDLSVKVKAQWLEDKLNRRSSGDAEYIFDASVLPAPIFTLGNEKIVQGEFVAITAENVIDPSQIQFSSTPSINFEPKFTEVDGYAVALVPISYDLEYNEAYEFTLTYGDTTKKLTLGVEQKNYKTINLPTSAATLNSYRTTASVNEYNEILNNYLKSSSTSKYFDGYFGEGSGKPLTILMGFGLNATLETGGTYRNEGVDFGYAADTDTAVAVNAGSVVYTGKLTYSGNTVIIDHGLGLMSVYCNLDSISVSVGQNIGRGDTVGIIGKTGCTDILRLHVALYVYGVPVQPYRLWNDGEDKEVKIYVPQK